MMKATIVALMCIATVGAGSLTAQTIQHRKYDQQARIGQGVRSGELTHRETRHVERQEHAINREEHAMRAENGGRLTRGDRAVLNHQQNGMSREIYRDKHNGFVR